MSCTCTRPRVAVWPKSSLRTQVYGLRTLRPVGSYLINIHGAQRRHHLPKVTPEQHFHVHWLSWEKKRYQTLMELWYRVNAHFIFVLIGTPYFSAHVFLRLAPTSASTCQARICDPSFQYFNHKATVFIPICLPYLRDSCIYMHITSHCMQGSTRVCLS